MSADDASKVFDPSKLTPEGRVGLRPQFTPTFFGTLWPKTEIPSVVSVFDELRDGVAWVNRSSPRDECFMAGPGAPRVYSYGNNNEKREELHTYHAVDMHPAVLAMMRTLNDTFDWGLNVCVLNYYKDERQHLGWHADDSPEQDLTHPIAVTAFGEPRYIWVREKGAQGVVPDSDKFLMTPGSLFVMPGGFQDTHFHRIPKHDRKCGGRISLTFRRLVR